MKNKILFMLAITILISTIAMPFVQAQEPTNCNIVKDINLSKSEIDCIQNMLTVCNKNDIVELFPEISDMEIDMNKYQADLDTAVNVICSEYNIEVKDNVTKDDLLDEITTKIQETTPVVAPIVSAEPTPSAEPVEATPVPTAIPPNSNDVTLETSMPTEEVITTNTDEETTETLASNPIDEMLPEVSPIVPTPSPTLTPVPTATPTTQVLPNNSKSISTIEMEMIIMVNEDRAAAGLPPLAASSEVSSKAREHSMDMSANNFFSHTSPTYGGFSERLRNSGLSYVTAGENIALYNSIEKAQAGLMASDGHRANILGKNFTHIGIGIVWNEQKGAYYITQWFTKQ